MSWDAQKTAGSDELTYSKEISLCSWPIQTLWSHCFTPCKRHIHPCPSASTSISRGKYRLALTRSRKDKRQPVELQKREAPLTQCQYHLSFWCPLQIHSLIWHQRWSSGTQRADLFLSLIHSFSPPILFIFKVPLLPLHCCTHTPCHVCLILFQIGTLSKKTRLRNKKIK